MNTAITLTIYNYTTNERLEEASEYEAARYMAMLEKMWRVEAHAGAVDGAEFGFPGLTIYMI